MIMASSFGPFYFLHIVNATEKINPSEDSPLYATWFRMSVDSDGTDQPSLIRRLIFVVYMCDYENFHRLG